MKLALSPRIAGSTLVLFTIAISAIAVASSAIAMASSAAAAPSPQKTVKASLLKRRPNTLAPGTSVKSSQLGHRLFVNGNDGFALANTNQAQYPAATTNGGKTWRTDGPALHVNAADAPAVVLNIGAAGRKTIFAYGGGQALDTTADGGKHWYGALFNGLVMAVVQGASGHLVAFIDGSTSGTSSAGAIWQYVSTNRGRTWNYDTTTGG
jgi:hypothetical protein